MEIKVLTLGKSEAISVTAEWIFSEHGTKLEERNELFKLVADKVIEATRLSVTK